MKRTYCCLHISPTFSMDILAFIIIIFPFMNTVVVQLPTDIHPTYNFFIVSTERKQLSLSHPHPTETISSKASINKVRRNRHLLSVSLHFISDAVGRTEKAIYKRPIAKVACVMPYFICLKFGNV